MAARGAILSRCSPASFSRRTRSSARAESTSRVRAVAPPEVVTFEVDADGMPASPAPASPAARVLLVVGAGDSPLKYPPQLPPEYGSESGLVAWPVVAEQLRRRLAWMDPPCQATVLVAGECEQSELAEAAQNADVFVAMGVTSDAEAEAVAASVSTIPTGVAFGSATALEDATRLLFMPANALASIARTAAPWSGAAKEGALFEQVQELYSRGNHLDLFVAVQLLVNEVAFVPNVNAKDSLDASGLFCLFRYCTPRLVDCVKDDNCPKALKGLEDTGLTDQTKAYTVIRSYESDAFQRLSLCINQKHNCLGNTATRPEEPAAPAITTFRGEPLTHEAAEEILIGARGPDSPSSWMLVCGQNPAYDEFPCQFQMFYRGKAKKSIWYNPVFKVNTLDGREVWRRSDYKVTRDDVPGQYIFTFCDNGVTSRELWRIIGAADDLSYCVFYYAGAAETAGQAYIGAMIATPDGEFPSPEALPAITAALKRGGLTWHEMISADNTNCAGAPLEPLHPDRDLPM
mmetsp:Transcript_19800/g.64361  ORF Transcript_19800/g.64361 Transcript_19800/m.64361 type:complete len:518 (+) Transcript_19800:33-1586(+)